MIYERSAWLPMRSIPWLDLPATMLVEPMCLCFNCCRLGHAMLPQMKQGIRGLHLKLRACISRSSASLRGGGTLTVVDAQGCAGALLDMATQLLWLAIALIESISPPLTLLPCMHPIRHRPTTVARGSARSVVEQSVRPEPARSLLLSGHLDP